MENKTLSNFADTVIGNMKKAVTELEEFRVQANLGAAEAKEKFEEAKKLFDHYIGELNRQVEKGQEKTDELKSAFEQLQVQLALGKAETKELFEEQRTKITAALTEVERIIRKNEKANEVYLKLLPEVEKFKIKLEIMRLRFELNKLDKKMDFEEKKKEFADKLNEIKARFSGEEKKAEERWENFRSEISDAFVHLKNSFTK
ncbi:MAG: hypothetical protein POELPBGB_00352 [Bacteroidia bacterium]|nr:hypothetical protein [Bacteroidia bacterium]